MSALLRHRLALTVRGADACVLPLHLDVDAGVLQQSEQVRGQAAVLEQVEEALHVRERLRRRAASVFALSRGGRPLLPLPLATPVGEDAPFPLQRESERIAL